jgi:hypothetical protein
MGRPTCKTRLECKYYNFSASIKIHLENSSSPSKEIRTRSLSWIGTGMKNRMEKKTTHFTLHSRSRVSLGEILVEIYVGHQNNPMI